MEQKEQAIRLTLRVPETLEKLIKEEGARRGTSMNQTMLYILQRAKEITAE